MCVIPIILQIVYLRGIRGFPVSNKNKEITCAYNMFRRRAAVLPFTIPQLFTQTSDRANE